MEDRYIEALLARSKLNLSEEETQWVKTAFAGYRPQLEELMSLDLAGDEVGTAFSSFMKAQ
jgi:hypothetical protein